MSSRKHVKEVKRHRGVGDTAGEGKPPTRSAQKAPEAKKKGGGPQDARAAKKEK
jgi:hypothetical protein